MAGTVFEILWIQTKMMPLFDVSDESRLNRCSQVREPFCYLQERGPLPIMNLISTDRHSGRAGAQQGCLRQLRDMCGAGKGEMQWKKNGRMRSRRRKRWS